MSHKSFALFGLGQSYIQIFEKRNQLEYHDYFVLTQQQQQQQQQKQQKKKEQIFICRAPLILFLKIFFHLMFYGRSSILVPMFKCQGISYKGRASVCFEQKLTYVNKI